MSIEFVLVAKGMNVNADNTRVVARFGLFVLRAAASSSLPGEQRQKMVSREAGYHLNSAHLQGCPGAVGTTLQSERLKPRPAQGDREMRFPGAER